MTATYTLAAEEITVDILQSIKEAFKGKTVDIVVSETMDETEYLLSSPANRESLLRSMKELEEGKGITFTIEELKERYGVK